MTTPASTSFTGSAVVCGLRDMYPGGRTVQTAIPCPDCDVPAEITERFSLPSTDGPVDHIVLRCAAGHCFRMAADRLAERGPAGRPVMLVSTSSGRAVRA